jgi:hypothetical protein
MARRSSILLLNWNEEMRPMTSSAEIRRRESLPPECQCAFGGVTWASVCQSLPDSSLHCSCCCRLTSSGGVPKTKSTRSALSVVHEQRSTGAARRQCGVRCRRDSRACRGIESSPWSVSGPASWRVSGRPRSRSPAARQESILVCGVRRNLELGCATAYDSGLTRWPLSSEANG